MSSSRNLRNTGTGSNLHPLEQMASVAAGICLFRSGWHGRGVGGCLQLAIGTLLTLRGAQGHCALYEMLDIDTRSELEEMRGKGWHEARYSVSVARPAGDLYRRWRDLAGLPEILSHVKDVQVLDEQRSRWVVGGPVGSRIEFESRIEEDVPDRRIAWRSSEQAEVQNQGSVQFTPEGDHATRVTVHLRYQPPAGPLGQLAAKLFGSSPERQLADDLERFKYRMEQQPTRTAGENAS